MGKREIKVDAKPHPMIVKERDPKTGRPRLLWIMYEDEKADVTKDSDFIIGFFQEKSLKGRNQA